MKNWFDFSDFGKIGRMGDVELSRGLFILITLLVLALVLVLTALGNKRRKWTARELTSAAVCMAMGFVLSCVKLFSMPAGGSVTPASMLPLALCVLSLGPVKGLAFGIGYGLLQLVQGPYVIHPAQLLLDYPLAYGAVALGSCAAYLRLPARLRLSAAVLLAFLGRYVMAVISGSVFFAEYAPAGQNAWIYSLVYNLSYLGPDCVLCTLVALIPGIGRLEREIRKQSA